MRHQAPEPDEILVGGSVRRRTATPFGDEGLSVMGGEHGVCVADVDSEQHRPVPSRCENVSGTNPASTPGRAEKQRAVVVNALEDAA